MNNCKPSEEGHRIAVSGRVLLVTKSVRRSNDPVLAGLSGPVCRTLSRCEATAVALDSRGTLVVRATGTRCSD